MNLTSIGSIGQTAIYVCIIAFICAIAYIGMKQLKMEPPAWVVEVFWAIIVLVVIVTTIRWAITL